MDTMTDKDKLTVPELVDLGFDLQRKDCLSFYWNKKEQRKDVVTLHNYKGVLWRLEKHYKTTKITGTLGLFAHPYSKCIAVDVDNDFIENTTLYSGEDDIREQLESLLGKCCYVEHKIGAHGFHAYFKYTNSITLEFLKRIRYAVQDVYKIKCDFRTENMGIRLPQSFDYEEKYKDLSVINDISIIYKFLNETNVISGNVTSIFTRKRNKSTSGENIKSGNRIGGDGLQIKYGFQAISMGMSFEEYYDFVVSKNESSKDLSSSNLGSIKKDLLYTYNWCKRHHIDKYSHSKPKESGFKSNIHLISKEEQLWLEEIARIVCKREFRYEKTRVKKTESFAYLLKEILGFSRYQDRNPRSINAHIPLTEIKKKQYKKGYQFSQSWIEALKDHYDISTDIHQDFNICIHILMEQYFQNNRGWNFDPTYSCNRQYLGNNSITSMFRIFRAITSRQRNKKYIYLSGLYRSGLEDSYCNENYFVEDTERMLNSC